jgi:hypothetical protein
MKKITSILFAVVAMALVTFSSCGKYEEGPGFSLRSKKARVVGEWVIEKTIYNGVETSTGFDGITIEFKKDNTYTASFMGMTDNGKWDFDSKKENLEITDDTGDKTVEKILRLTNKELWLVEEVGGNKYETHYKAK